MNHAALSLRLAVSLLPALPELNGKLTNTINNTIVYPPIKMMNGLAFPQTPIQSTIYFNISTSTMGYR